MSLILQIFIFLSFFFTSVSDINAYTVFEKDNQIMCKPSDRFCYDSNHTALCDSDGLGYSSYSFCEYGCMSGICSKGNNNNVSQVTPSSFVAYSGGIAGCLIDGAWHPSGSCATTDSGKIGMCIAIASQNLAYLYPDNACCGSKVATSDGHCTSGCVGSNTGNTYTKGEYGPYYECFQTSPTNCQSWIYGDTSAFANKYCHFNTSSQCYCEGGGSWKRVGSGCHPMDTVSSGDYDCATGWTNSSSDPDTTGTTAKAICKPCNNNETYCYECKAAKTKANGNCNEISATCSTPTTTLCDAGNGSWTDETGDDGFFNWNCNGVDGQDGNCTKLVATDIGCSSIHKADIDGICGASNTGVFSSQPDTNLCSSGIGVSWTDSTAADGVYNWICKDQCSGTPSSCWADKNFPPQINSLTIRNVATTIVAPQTGNLNHVCQNEFIGSRTVIFYVNISDADGIGDITDITLTWNGVGISRVSAIGSTTRFEKDFTGINYSSAYPLVASIVDSKSQTDSDSSRSFKSWNCQVPINGTFYDGSQASVETGIVCGPPSSGFSIPADARANFNTMTFVDNNNVSKSMTVTPPSTYSSGSNSLVWGNIYQQSKINFGDLKIPTSSIKMIITDPVLSGCIDPINLTNNNQINPYDSNPHIVADFSGVIDQESWWQTDKGGSFSNQSIEDRVPVTCNTSNCQIGISSLVAAPTINNNTSKVNYQDWAYNGKLVDINNRYSFFMDQYFSKSGLGLTNATISSIVANSNPSGIYFVNGDLNITQDLPLPSSGFLMIIAKNNINIAANVKSINGILVADNINVTGENDNQLVIKGSIYAADTVVLSRSFVNKTLNNIQPAVKVDYDPQLIFKFPKEVTKVLSKWQWGN